MHLNNRDVSIHQYHEAPGEKACVFKELYSSSLYVLPQSRPNNLTEALVVSSKKS